MARPKRSGAHAAAMVAHDDLSATTPACPASRNARRYTPEIAERILGELQKYRPPLSVCGDDGMPAVGIDDELGFIARNTRSINWSRQSSD
jgi:hypothetical protein